MGLLGEFLEAFYGTGRGFERLHARLRREVLPSASSERSRRKPIGRSRQGTVKSSVVTIDYELWAVMPDRVRVDSITIENGLSNTQTEIIVGNQRFTRLPNGSAYVENLSKSRYRDSNSLPTEFRRHFDRNLVREFFASLTLEEIGECRVAGRKCVRMRAIPLPGDQLWPHWLPSEANAFEFDADLVIPSLLSIRCQLDGEMFDQTETVELHIDETIEEELFRCDPKPGEAIREAAPVVQRISLTEAITRVSFVILLPRSDLVGDDFEVSYETGRFESSNPHLTIFCRPNHERRLWFTLCQYRDSEFEERLEWEELQQSGQQFKLSDPQVDGGMSVLTFHKAGTWVKIYSDMDRDEVLDLALSFEPVQKG